jgi:hypothetical protein
MMQTVMIIRTVMNHDDTDSDDDADSDEGNWEGNR